MSGTASRRVTIYINDKEVENNIKSIKKEMYKLTAQQSKMTIGSKEYVQHGKKIKQLDKIIQNHRQEWKNTGGVWSKLKGLIPIASIGALAAGVKSLVKNVIEVRKEFQRYEAVLSTALGSEKEARIELNNLKNIAAKTPFSINELTDAYVKLVNQGFRPSSKEMIKMGDLAASTGKSFDQLAEAVIDAQTGEFERLKEFGIRAKKEGDKVTFSFKGVEKQVDFTSESIQQYILGLGEMEGVTGSMAKISETLGGQISNTKDNWTQFMDILGRRSDGVFFNVIGWLNSMIKAMSLAFKSIEQIKLEIADDQWIQTVLDDQDEINKSGELFIKTLELQIQAQEKRLRTGTKNIDQLILEKETFGKVKSAAIELSDEEKKQLVSEIDLNKARLAEANRYLNKIKEQEVKTVELTKEQIKAAEDAMKARKDANNAILGLQDDYYRSLASKNEKEVEDIQRKYEAIIEKAMDNGESKEKIAEYELQMQEAVNTKLLEQEKEKQDEEQKLIKEFQDKKLAFRKEYELLSSDELMQLELQKLQEGYDEKLISEEEFQRAKAEIEKRYKDLKANEDDEALEAWRDSLATIQAGTDALYSHIDNRRTTDLANLEKQKQKELKIAGDNSDEKYAIEAKYEEKEKELKKEYADADFAMKAANIGASTAAAIMGTWEGYADMGPIGTILAGIQTAALVLTGATQVAAANRERQAVKQLARGQYPVTGAQDGRLYHASYFGSVNTSGILNNGKPTLINEHGGEMISTAEHTRRILQVNPDLFDEWMSYRNGIPQRASGSYPQAAESGIKSTQATDRERQLIDALNMNTAAVNKLLSTPIKSYVVWNDLKKADRTMQDIEDFAAGN